MKMNKLKKLLLRKKVLLLLIFILTLKLSAFNVITDDDKKIDRYLLDGVELFHHGEYFKAIEEFRKFQVARPENSAGYFFESAVTEWFMIDNRNFSYQKDVVLFLLQISS